MPATLANWREEGELGLSAAGLGNDELIRDMFTVGERARFFFRCLRVDKQEAFELGLV